MKGETLKNFLRGRGFSNKWIADRLQMTDQNLSQLLAKDDIRTSLLERIAEAIGTTPAEIYGGHVTAKATGHSTAVVGTNNTVGDCNLLQKAMEQNAVLLEQNSRLIAIIEKMNK